MRPVHKKVALLAAGFVLSGLSYVVKEVHFDLRQKENRKRYKKERNPYWKRGR